MAENGGKCRSGASVASERTEQCAWHKLQAITMYPANRNYLFTGVKAAKRIVAQCLF